MSLPRAIASVMVLILLGAPLAIAAEDAATVSVPDPHLRELLLNLKNKYEHKGDDLTADDLRKIYFLAASGKEIQDLTGLEHCTNLGEARLANNAIVDITPLAACRNLQSLYLSKNQIEDLRPLSQCTRLQYLNVEHNQLESLDGVAALESLNSLYAAHNRIESLEPVQQLQRLWSLDLTSNRVSDMKPITALPRLTNLRLANNGIEQIQPFIIGSGMCTTDFRHNRIVDLGPLLAMAQQDKEKGLGYAQFWRLYLDGNPLGEAAQGQLESLTELGVRLETPEKSEEQSPEKSQAANKLSKNQAVTDAATENN